MSYVRATALFFAACLFAPAMHAGLITFIATGTVQDGATLSGDIVIDTTAGVVQSLSLTMSSPLSFTVTEFDSGLSFQGGQAYGLAADNGSPIPEIFLGIIGTTLVGYTGGGICTVGSPCTGGVNGSLAINPSFVLSNFTSGSLTQVPEPSSMALVGSAMLGLAAWRRRRSAK
ncbi:MAG TPA: PEP-CTERM sorting domain-containing protein [Bryobacteraceae bacterium]|nr:PEP-CTERM sorting domain-containing protein [Bryobacteraceae bacterium]